MKSSFYNPPLLFGKNETKNDNTEYYTPKCRTNYIMKLKIKILLLSIFTVVHSSSAQKNSENFDPLPVLQFFVGQWSGEATAYFPRDSTKANRHETIRATGKKMLKDSYIEISSIWTQPDGTHRQLLEFINYHVRKDSFQVLYLYDNWPGRVDYPLSYDPDSKTFEGYDTFMARGGVPAEEKVVWKVAKDGSEIRGTEYNHLATDPDDFWPKTFEYVLRREED